MSTRQVLASTAVALGIFAGAGTLTAQTRDTTIPTTIGDLNAAQLIEVRDQSGKVLLNGTLKTEATKRNGIERKAELVSPSGDKAEGDFEVEIERKQKNGSVETRDEIELEVEHLPGVLQCELFIDGKRVTSFVTSRSGKAAFELERKSAGW